MVGRRALLAASALLPAAPVRAQQRPMRIITPFAPGGATDALARLVGLRITALTDQTVVVEPKPGAGGDLAMQAAAAAEPDGHTLVLGSDSSLVRNPLLRRAIPYDPERDFAPIARLVISWYAIAVHAAGHGRCARTADACAAPWRRYVAGAERASSRRRYFSTFPVALTGSASTNTARRGTL